MSRKCQISGKGNHRGNKVSHANNKSLKCWRANIHFKRVFDSTSGKWVRLKISSRTLRTINKKGLRATLKDAGLRIEDVS